MMLTDEQVLNKLKAALDAVSLSVKLAADKPAVEFVLTPDPQETGEYIRYSIADSGGESDDGRPTVDLEVAVAASDQNKAETREMVNRVKTGVVGELDGDGMTITAVETSYDGEYGEKRFGGVVTMEAVLL